MKGFLITLGVIAAVVLLFGLSIVSRGCDTASNMAEKTVFNADKHVWSYEEFHRKYTAYEQYRVQKAGAEAALEKLEKKGVTSGQSYDNKTMEIDGIRNMMNRIAADYNAMSQIAYQKIWKSKGLPERLD